MNLQEFESQTRERLERALNHLQTATLLLSALEVQLLESGNTVRDLGSTIEQFISTNQNS